MRYGVYGYECQGGRRSEREMCVLLKRMRPSKRPGSYIPLCKFQMSSLGGVVRSREDARDFDELQLFNLMLAKRFPRHESTTLGSAYHRGICTSLGSDVQSYGVDGAEQCVRNTRESRGTGAAGRGWFEQFVD